MSSISSVEPFKQALVFCDDGIGRSSSLALVEQLKAMLDPSIVVKLVSAHYLKTADWESKTVALAMGGGSCSHWDTLLGSEGVMKIRNYVQNGIFIGLCAGAYFVSSKSSFTLKDKSPIQKQRDLSFFSGIAIGPMVETDVAYSPKSARAMPVTFDWGSELDAGHLYYQDGCFFEVSPDDLNTEVLASHEGKPVAIVCKVDNGRAFLCGLHPEFIWDESVKGNLELEALNRVLKSSESFRSRVWAGIGKHLNLPVRD
jgi:glutamine amidotransferase-like uncharacterized protein